MKHLSEEKICIEFHLTKELKNMQWTPFPIEIENIPIEIYYFSNKILKITIVKKIKQIEKLHLNRPSFRMEVYSVKFETFSI